MPRSRAVTVIAEKMFCDIVAEEREPWYWPLEDAKEWHPYWQAILDSTGTVSYSTYWDAVDAWSKDHPHAAEEAEVATWMEATAEQRARWVTGYLYNDKTPMPAKTAEQLGFPQGTPFSVAVRKLRRKLGDRRPGISPKPDKGKLVRIQVNLDDETAELIKARAEEMGISTSEFLRRAIDHAREHQQEFDEFVKESGDEVDPSTVRRRKRSTTRAEEDDDASGDDTGALI